MTATIKNSMVLPQILKIELSYDPVKFTSGNYPPKSKAGSQRDIVLLMFLAALFTIAQRYK